MALAACGESSSDSNQPAGRYPVEVTTASFPTKQRLGQTSLLRLGVRNSGKHTVPALTISFTIAGKQGVDSVLPFGVRDPEPGLAIPDRPVWVLAQSYPKLAGSSKPGGASTSNARTFAFGPLKPGATTEAVWKLSAVKAGHYNLLFTVDAGVSGTAKAETGRGATPGGSFATDVTAELPETEVTDSGEIVEIKPGGKRSHQGE
ncbi:MAG TPA: hypothetical protein VF731_02090 [Solirubrobacterales bacterium]